MSVPVFAREELRPIKFFFSSKTSHESEVSRIRAASQILGLQAQIKLYQASSSEGGK